MLALMGAEVAFYPLRIDGVGSAYLGHDGVREWFDAVARANNPHRIEVADIFEIGDERIVSAGRVIVGDRNVTPFSGLYSFESGAIIELHHYYTTSFDAWRLGLLDPRGRIVTLMEAQSDVTAAIRSGIPFDAIEDRIQQIPDLVDEERSALWLYAWSLQGRRWQRAAATQLLRWTHERTGGGRSGRRDHRRVHAQR